MNFFKKYSKNNLNRSGINQNRRENNQNRREHALIKREILANAALKRQTNWKQNINPLPKKDKIISKINEIYRKKNIDPPIGLYSCNNDVLEKHLKRIISN